MKAVGQIYDLLDRSQIEELKIRNSDQKFQNVQMAISTISTRPKCEISIKSKYLKSFFDKKTLKES